MDLRLSASGISRTSFFKKRKEKTTSVLRFDFRKAFQSKGNACNLIEKICHDVIARSPKTEIQKINLN